MRLVTYSHRERSAALGMVVDGRVIDLADIGYKDILRFLEEGGKAVRRAERFAKIAEEGPRFEDVKLHAPVPRPRQVYLHRVELQRPRGRIRHGNPGVADRFHEVFERGVRPRRSDRPSRCLEKGRLRGGVGVRDRPPGEERQSRRLGRLRFRLCLRPRRQRAGLSTGDFAVDHRQDVRYVRGRWVRRW